MVREVVGVVVVSPADVRPELLHHIIGGEVLDGLLLGAAAEQHG